MAPPHTAYRPTYTPAKPQNPFSGRSQNSRPNPFAKYSYLQKEHNRSPLEYKSPYRPGGGFMNGYQGSLEKHIEHLKQTMFRKSSGSGSTLTNMSSPLLSYNGVSGSSYSSASPTPSAPYTPGTPTYGAYASPPTSASKSGPPNQASKPIQNPAAWEKKDVSLHPAIRQEYSTMFHHQYQPSPRPSTQYQGAVMPPPAIYNGQTPQVQPPYQPSPSFQAQPPQSQQQTPPPHPSDAYSVRPGAQPLHAQQTTTQSQYQYTPGMSQPQAPPYNEQYVSAGHPQPSSYQPNHMAQYQTPQVSYQENKPLYAHQQYFQNLNQNQKPAVSAPISDPQCGPQVRDLPDVQPDSASLIEKMLKSLRKLPVNT